MVPRCSGQVDVHIHFSPVRGTIFPLFLPSRPSLFTTHAGFRFRWFRRRARLHHEPAIPHSITLVPLKPALSQSGSESALGQGPLSVASAPCTIGPKDPARLLCVAFS